MILYAVIKGTEWFLTNSTFTKPNGSVLQRMVLHLGPVGAGLLRAYAGFIEEEEEDEGEKKKKK